MVAVDAGKTVIAQLLLEHKANPEANGGYTALMWAAYSGHEKVMLAIIKQKANIEATAHTGDTACDLAIKRGHSETAQLLTL